jgi:SAM-dependent methyltransferase
LNKRFPFADSSVYCIRAFDVIEHLSDKNHTMSEIHRVLQPGGYALINVPSTDGRGAFQDPSHCSFWNLNSFWYYTDREYAKYIDNTTIRFKAVTLFQHFPNDWCRENNISYVSTVLMCLKDGYRPHGQIDI